MKEEKTQLAFSSLKLTRGYRKPGQGENPTTAGGYLCGGLNGSTWAPFQWAAEWQQLTSNPRHLTNWSFVQQVFASISVYWARAPCQGDFWCPHSPVVQSCICRLSLSTDTQDKVPRPAAAVLSSSLWELVRNANPWLYPDLLNQHLALGFRNLCFNSSPADSCAGSGLRSFSRYYKLLDREEINSGLWVTHIYAVLS